MKKIFISLSITLSLLCVNAQIQHGGTPYSLSESIPSFSRGIVTLPEFDLDYLKQEDDIFDLQKDIPFRFGYNFDVNYTTKNSGEWTLLSNGDRIWRITFYSEGAQSLNFLLKDFQLAEGCSLFFYNEDYTSILGSFTNENNREHKNLATQLIFGDKITLEFYEPKQVKNLSHFAIKRVTHGYRSLKIPTKGVGDSGSCNNNVICAVGDDWREQIRAAAIIIVFGNGICSGSLINNTCQDKTPYFLTAHHCTDGADVTTWSIGFNFESTDCNGDLGYNNISYQSTNVLALRARNTGSDFALLELVETPPESYNVFFAGWDKTGTTPTSQVGIHHPAGDLKKISFDEDPASSASWGGASTWHISDWEDGTTEGGSSGSPLFDQNKRIIGQLFGGTASCFNNVDDYYGKFDVSWNGGTNSTNQLVTWLDGCNTSENFIDGIDGSANENDASIEFINKPINENCGTTISQQIKILNKGFNILTSVTFNYGINIQSYTWTGSLNQDEFEIIDLGDLFLCEGENFDYSLEITASNLIIDENLQNNSDSFDFSVANGNVVRIEILTNFASSETSFELKTQNGDIIFEENSFSNNTLYTYEKCLAKDDYIFKIFDSGSNGLTALFASDSGYYNIYLNGLLLNSNDDFGAEETITFSAAGNGLLANFNNPDQIETIAFDLSSISFGFVTSHEWTAIDATSMTGNSTVFNTSFDNNGIYDVTLKIKNDQACDIVTKQITVLEYTSLNDLETYFNQSIYPNPTNNTVTVETDYFKNTTITLTNNIGKVVFTKTLTSNKENIDLSTFSKGIYLLTLKNQEHISTFKILKD